jgi:CIC family chloride channel protein
MSPSPGSSTCPWLCRRARPCVGLALTAVILRLGGPAASSSTSDDYIRAFHDGRAGRLRLRDLPVKMAAAVTTLGFGVPLGYEGPAIYAGASIGSATQRRLTRLFSAEQAKVLMVAGAAAGVAAVFKAPVTGLVFAMEVPFQDDLARRMVLPAAISSAASYVTFAAIAGTEPLLPVAGRPPFNLVDLGGAAVIGLVAGVLARLFVLLIREAKRISSRGHPALRVAVAVRPSPRSRWQAIPWVTARWDWARGTTRSAGRSSRSTASWPSSPWAPSGSSAPPLRSVAGGPEVCSSPW